MEKEKFKAYLAWATICVVWGTTYLAIRIGVEDLPPMLFAGFRWLLAGSIFLCVMLLRGKKIPDKKSLVKLSISGILMLGMANGFVVIAEQWIPSGLTALIITTMPFWMAGFESLIPEGVKLNKITLIGLLFGFGGTALIFGNELGNFSESNYLIGIVLVFGAMISWALGSLYSKYRKADTDPITGSTIQMIVAGAVQTIIGLSIGEFEYFSFTTDSLLAFSYLVFIASMAGFAAYMYAINHLPLSFVTTYAYINPIIAIFLGWLVLDEKISVEMIFAAMIIFAGVAIVKKGSIDKGSEEKNKLVLEEE